MFLSTIHKINIIDCVEEWLLNYYFFCFSGNLFKLLLIAGKNGKSITKVVSTYFYNFNHNYIIMIIKFNFFEKQIIVHYSIKSYEHNFQIILLIFFSEFSQPEFHSTHSELYPSITFLNIQLQNLKILLAKLEKKSLSRQARSYLQSLKQDSFL